MTSKQKTAAARQTFRQFAWNLAGTLASTRAGGKSVAKPGGKR